MIYGSSVNSLLVSQIDDISSACTKPVYALAQIPSIAGHEATEAIADSSKSSEALLLQVCNCLVETWASLLSSCVRERRMLSWAPRHWKLSRDRTMLRYPFGELLIGPM